MELELDAMLAHLDLLRHRNEDERVQMRRLISVARCEIYVQRRSYVSAFIDDVERSEKLITASRAAIAKADEALSRRV